MLRSFLICVQWVFVCNRFKKFVLRHNIINNCWIKLISIIQFNVPNIRFRIFIAGKLDFYIFDFFFLNKWCVLISFVYHIVLSRDLQQILFYIIQEIRKGNSKLNYFHKRNIKGVKWTWSKICRSILERNRNKLQPKSKICFINIIIPTKINTS